MGRIDSVDRVHTKNELKQKNVQIPLVQYQAVQSIFGAIYTVGTFLLQIMRNYCVYPIGICDLNCNNSKKLWTFIMEQHLCAARCQHIFSIHIFVSILKPICLPRYLISIVKNNKKKEKKNEIQFIESIVKLYSMLSIQISMNKFYDFIFDY